MSWANSCQRLAPNFCTRYKLTSSALLLNSTNALDVPPSRERWVRWGYKHPRFISAAVGRADFASASLRARRAPHCPEFPTRRTGFPSEVHCPDCYSMSSITLEDRMNESILFSNYLHDRMTETRISADHLIHEMDYKTAIHVQSWLDGRSRPPVWQLLRLASILKADPVDVIVGWVIDQCPELEEVLRTQVLDPRKSKFPRSTELTLRAPKPGRRVPLW